MTRYLYPSRLATRSNCSRASNRFFDDIAATVKTSLDFKNVAEPVPASIAIFRSRDLDGIGTASFAQDVLNLYQANVEKTSASLFLTIQTPITALLRDPSLHRCSAEIKSGCNINICVDTTYFESCSAAFPSRMFM